jgi:acyl-CoA thioesterase II
MGDFGLDTDVQGADGSYTATFSKDWHIWGPAGGYVAAVAMRAFGVHSAFARPASFTCHFLGVGEYREVDIDVRTLRRGRSAESLALTISQDGKPILEAVAWTVGDVEGLNHDHVQMPDVAKPNDLKSVEELLTPAQKAQTPPFNFWSNFDERPLSWLGDDEWMTRPAGDPIFQHWARFRPTPTFDDPFTEAARLLVLLDVAMWPAAARGYAREDLTFIAPSLDLSAVFHHIEGAGGWLLVDGHSSVAADGIVGGDGRVWSEDGTLLCSGVQSMLCRPAMRPS